MAQLNQLLRYHISLIDAEHHRLLTEAPYLSAYTALTAVASAPAASAESQLPPSSTPKAATKRRKPITSTSDSTPTTASGLPSTLPPIGSALHTYLDNQHAETQLKQAVEQRNLLLLLGDHPAGERERKVVAKALRVTEEAQRKKRGR